MMILGRAEQKTTMHATPLPITAAIDDRGMQVMTVGHSGAGRRPKPGIHTPQPWLWIPGSRLRRAPE
jgi:hypothetical protein